jgi:DNA-binding beta-propeller fold protein YncE
MHRGITAEQLPVDTARRRFVGVAAAALAAAALVPRRGTGGAEHPRLAIAHARGDYVSLFDPRTYRATRIAAGAAPHGLAVTPDGLLYVATGEGLAVLDPVRGRREAPVRYATVAPSRESGEYRPGGWGIAAAPDAARVYVAVYRPGEASMLEVFDARARRFVAAAPVGQRPFDAIADRVGDLVYTIDHDTHSVTVIDARTLRTRAIRVAPLGAGAFDRLHFAAAHPDGTLLLPVQGRVLVRVDPRTGAQRATPLATPVHQHGVALSADARRLYIVGQGAVPRAGGAPDLAMVDLATGRDERIALDRAHEQVALASDECYAYLTGGSSLTGGWDGLTVLDLAARAHRAIALADPRWGSRG